MKLKSRKQALVAALLTFMASSALSAVVSPSAPPKLRLGEQVEPTRYAVELTVVPTDDTFSGAIDIDLELRAATSFIWLNATELTVREASLDAEGRSIPVQTVPGDTDFLGFAFDRPVGPGSGKLHIRYQGKFAKKEDHGLYKVKDKEDWYAFTQFESIDARWAFPCFDEPSFKVPWRITLHVKKEHVAISNTPVVSESEGTNGLKTIKFAETKPLPSYLVALAVGPLEFVDVGKAGKKGTPIRIVTPRGRVNDARYAAQVTPEILTQLENYFGIPYPYEKLDMVAVPRKRGAMENPGLVTFGESAILSKPNEQTGGFKRRYAGVCAHELAHQWFGDLVTTAWWDDIWLNEGFATWMGTKIVRRWKPEWDNKMSRISSRPDPMISDSLVSARKIRQPIESKNDIANAFDGITYGKGAAVLKMFEAWIGEDKFQRGIQHYLTKYAWRNATSADFLAAIGTEAGREVTPAFSTFLDQAGVPLVSVELVCNGAPKLTLTQTRYLPAGSQGSSQQIWQIPVCVRYGIGKSEEHVCMLLTNATGELTLASAKSCPDWVLANEGQSGYYRVLYRGDLLNRLLKDGGKRLSLPERLGVISDLSALGQAGQIPMGDVLARVSALLNDPDPQILSATIDIVANLGNHLVPDALRPNYARFIRKTYGARAHALGWREKPGEDEDVRLLRPTLLRLVAGDGEDKALIAEASSLARRWLQDHQTMDPDLLSAILHIAAMYGDRALFDRFYAEAKKTSDRTERARLLSAMGSFRDADILKAALSIALTEEFDSLESVAPVLGARGNPTFSVTRDPKTRALVYEFVKQNFDALVAKLPRDSGANLARVASGFCDEEHRADVEAFFKDRATKFVGGPRILAQTLEQIRLCSAFRRAQQTSVAAFLKN